MLRVEDFRLPRRHVEEVGVEEIDALETAAGLDQARVPQALGANPRGARLVVAILFDRFAAGAQIAPVLVEIRRAGKRPDIPTTAIAPPLSSMGSAELSSTMTSS